MTGPSDAEAVVMLFMAGLGGVSIWLAWHIGRLSARIDDLEHRILERTTMKGDGER
jgi:hypothetical protein